ncbi:MAG: nanT 1 [Phycisphaerales bacterium]|nr:nanT 1 [Phycisphaerales bacterium]
MTQTTPTPVLEYGPAEPRLTSAQWKSGIAAWLGWLFDGLDMHLFGMVAVPFVTLLLADMARDPSINMDNAVKMRSGLIQGAFLIGWAIGGGFFGRIGDRLGRSRALALTVLTYACFTGLSFFATQWWHLLIFRFLAALGIGGEWAVGSSLLSETWPKSWRPWIAAGLQTAVNIGVLLAYVTAWVLAPYHPKYVFLVGVLPAFIVFWIRRAVPEPAEWHAAQAAVTQHPSIRELFRGPARRITLLTIMVCACSLTAWWAFMFWMPQLVRELPDIKAWPDTDRKRLYSTALMIPVLVSIPGNFFAGWLAKLIGFRQAIAVLCIGFGAAMFAAFVTTHAWRPMLYFYIPLVGFFSGIFGLFTMYLPPLFPTLLRTTGAGFCYNIGRIVTGIGVVFFGYLAVSQSGQQQGNLRLPLLYGAFLFIPAMVAALALPELKDADAASPTEPID